MSVLFDVFENNKVWDDIILEFLLDWFFCLVVFCFKFVN